MMEALVLPAETGSLGELIGFISRRAAMRGFPEKKIRYIELAAEEALVNVMRHAYPGGGAGAVEVHCGMADERRFMIQIVDGGIPFDPDDAKPPDLKAGIAERRVGGLGLFFIQKMADNVSRRREGHRNILTLTFYRDKGA
jgi:serine/threonine-protein kinase RsbW